MTADDTARAIAAGWNLTDGAEAPYCEGSGQGVMFDAARFVTCPVCGERVAAILPELDGSTPPYIGNHYPPALPPLTLDL